MSAGPRLPLGVNVRSAATSALAGWLLLLVAGCEPFQAEPVLCGGALTDLTTDEWHCGACDSPCSEVRGVARGECVDGVCRIVTCATDGERERLDLDGRHANGCEVERARCDGRLVDLQVDPAHCGACGHSCEQPPHRPPHALEVSCSVGLCVATRCTGGPPVIQPVVVDGRPAELATCDPPPPHCAEQEVCNRVDDDCDGLIDECAQPPGTEPRFCEPAQDADAADGSTLACPPPRCRQGFVALGGDPAAGCLCELRGPERCNGLDDDCDGSVDEDLGELSCGVGACYRTVPACVDGAQQRCEAGQPAREACNGVDDDCDGVADAAEGVCPGCAATEQALTLATWPELPRDVELALSPWGAGVAIAWRDGEQLHARGCEPEAGALMALDTAGEQGPAVGRPRLQADGRGALHLLHQEELWRSRDLRTWRQWDRALSGQTFGRPEQVLDRATCLPDDDDALLLVPPLTAAPPWLDLVALDDHCDDSPPAEVQLLVTGLHDGWASEADPRGLGVGYTRLCRAERLLSGDGASLLAVLSTPQGDDATGLWRLDILEGGRWRTLRAEQAPQVVDERGCPLVVRTDSGALELVDLGTTGGAAGGASLDRQRYRPEEDASQITTVAAQPSAIDDGRGAYRAGTLRAVALDTGGWAATWQEHAADGEVVLVLQSSSAPERTTLVRGCPRQGVHTTLLGGPHALLVWELPSAADDGLDAGVALMATMPGQDVATCRGIELVPPAVGASGFGTLTALAPSPADARDDDGAPTAATVLYLLADQPAEAAARSMELLRIAVGRRSSRLQAVGTVLTGGQGQRRYLAVPDAAGAHHVTTLEPGEGGARLVHRVF